MENVGIRDGNNPGSPLDSDKYYEVFQDSSDSSYKLKEYIFQDNGTEETNDDFLDPMANQCLLLVLTWRIL